MEETGEVGSGGLEEPSRPLDSPLKLLQTQPKCELYPDLHKIIQVSRSGKKVESRAPEETSLCFHLQEKFMDVFSQYFKPVPSNPFYYFYCPLSKKDVSPHL